MNWLALSLALCGTEPRLGAIWIEPAAIAAVARDAHPENLRQLTQQSLRAARQLSIETVILAYPEFLGTFFYRGEATFFDRDVGKEVSARQCPFDVYSAVLDEADRLGMRVFLGVGRQGDTNLLWEFDDAGWPGRLERALSIAKAVADDLHRAFGQHPSFAGWYLSHEMNDLHRSRAYYDPLAIHCRSLGTARKVMISPSGTPILTPEDIRDCQVDIFAYQDAVGAGYVPYRYTYDSSQRLAMLDEIYRDYALKHQGTGKEIWANLEVWQMDGKSGYARPFPASWDRVRKQIETEAPHVSLLSAYAWHGFFQQDQQDHETPIPAAQDLWRRYQDYCRQPAR
jgi:hypothetical protein